MSREIQDRIDAINWYHEFDFGDGLVAKPKTPDIENHRKFWDHIHSRLDSIDFVGKTVLDIGCWDGYWSYYAEKRGAAHVLAIDDRDQNWASDAGLRLAKELFRSSIEINTELSVYDLANLQKKFDIILCLGVYYHLIDPFYAFAQIRHCCHDNSIVVFEGDVRSPLGMPPGTGIHNFNVDDGAVARFRPTPALLSSFLEAAYLRVQSESFYLPWNLQAPPPPSPAPSCNRFRRAIQAFKAAEQKPPKLSKDNQPLYNRIVSLCQPFRGENQCYWYRPPFGLDRYDERWERVQNPKLECESQRPAPTGQLCNTAYGHMYILAHDVPRGRALIKTGKAPDHDTIEWLCTFLEKRRNPVAVDAGANFGCYALAFARHGAMVHAFEPQPMVASLLAESVKLNHSSIVVHNTALGLGTGPMSVPIVDYNREADFGTVKLTNANEGLRIETVALDSMELPQLDLLKIDVEGMELDVLTGARQTIARCRPLIFVEFWLSDQLKLEKQIRDQGYEIIDKGGQDWLCVPAEHAPYALLFRTSQRATKEAQQSIERAWEAETKAQLISDRVQQAEKELRQKSESAQQVDARLRAVLASTSWRITAPLRWCKLAITLARRGSKPGTRDSH
jgi:tRNA (mo5U34)-methyltransferase